MLSFIVENAGALGVLFFMTLATMASSGATRILLTVVALLTLLAHAGFMWIILGIGSSGSVADAALAKVRNGVLFWGALTLVWAYLLVSRSQKTPDPASETTAASDRGSS